ncbi:MAG: motility associated factor glycosyltransferase family protein [Sedimentisphaerales bacterium]|nr:motility associated factor glycosyltransferase family protein [Sedimentisphaerales bacterium]
MTLKLPDIIEPNTPYLANMKTLWEKWPLFAQQLDRVDENDFIPCIKTKTGDLTCMLSGQSGEPVYMHSRYDPKREADRWAQGAVDLADKQQDEESSRIPMCYMVDGFGLGYHVKALFERLTGEAFIVISERNIPLIRTALHYFDYSRMLESDRVIFITGTEREEIFKKLERRAALMMLGVVFTRSLQRVDTEFHAQVHKTINEYAAFMRSHLVSLLGNSIITCKNILHNLPTYVSTAPIDMLKNRFKGEPAVIVSAGPSLGKNIELLREIRENVVVIAVQTTLKPLLAHGIVPDYVTSLDYHEASKRFFEGIEDLSQVHMVAEPKATWHVIDYYRRRGPLSLLGNEFANLILRGTGIENSILTAGATVAHLSFYLAEYLGADPIIFLGQDLAFTDNVYYSPGNALHEAWRGEQNRFCAIEMKEWERIVRHRGILRKVEDIHGQEIYTDEQMFTYLQQFEKDFAKSTAQIIDATEGGARKQNAQILSFKETAQRYCQKTLDRHRFKYRDEIENYNTNRLDDAYQALKKRIEEIEELKDISSETIELLHEMINLVDDQLQLNIKMVRLDELRTKVKHRNDTYRLVMFVGQMAEMFRFREDRALEIDNIEGKDMQRRQLRRDIGYVTEVKKSCDRLLDMLQEGLERFDLEMENLSLKSV